MDVLIGIVMLAIGGVIGYLLAERRRASGLENLRTSLATAEQRNTNLATQCESHATQVTELRSQLSESEKKTSALSAHLESAKQNLLEQRQLLDGAQMQLRQAFASVSAEALAKNNEAFLQLARERFATISTEAAGTLEHRKAQIEGLLKPMQELLNQYQSRLGDIEKSRVESYSMLREQLGVLTETQRTLNTQTSQLVTALRRPQTRGQWGEVTLRRLVELAGMSNRCDFTEQTSVDTEEGKLRPDMVIHMPLMRSIVIDCKTSLDAFLDAAATEDEDARKLCMQRHTQQVKARARELAGKSYWSQFKQSPEFVVMFLPGEAFLYAAIEQDGALIEDTLKTRVIIATPTTLMALLRTIEFGWRQEEVTQNAEEIRKYGKDLYDRIAILAGHFAKLGGNLDSAVSAYNTALGSLELRVLVTARKIAELGARSDKEIQIQEPIDARPRELSAALLDPNRPIDPLFPELVEEA
jgi:DNA recombination protein RmuC